MTNDSFMRLPAYCRCLTALVFSCLIIACGSEGKDSKAGSSTEIKPSEPAPNIELSAWPNSYSSIANVAAAPLSGLYAMSSENSLAVEVRDIRKNLIVELTPDMFDSAISKALPKGNVYVQGMTFTPTGRLLYFVIGDGTKQSLVAYNFNTRKLQAVSLGDLSLDALGSVGVNYFAGALYVGYSQGVHRIELDRNGVFNNEIGTINSINVGDEIRDITIDFDSKTLYLTGEDGIYRMPHDGLEATQIYSGDGVLGASFSREFGDVSSAGLYLLQHLAGETVLLRVSDFEARNQTQIVPQKYYTPETNWVDFTHTADGQILFTNGEAFNLAETSDSRLSFELWLRDEFSQYMQALKGLIASDETGNQLSPEGFIHNGLQAHSANRLPVAENVGWAIYMLMLEDAVNGDQNNLSLVELIIKRHAGLHEDGLGGIRTVDGHFERNYTESGEQHPTNSLMQVYTSMKFLPAVYKAAEFYPESEDIAHYLKYLRQVFVRSGDVVRGEQRITWESDDFGPLRVNRKMNNETWIFGDLAAAQDPNATVNYDHYTYDRASFNVDETLAGEPVMEASHPAFIVFGATLILDHHYSGDGWQELNHNYYALTQSETDEQGFPYFAAFSAGNNTSGTNNYHADGPVNHPGDYIHFPALLGFGQHGKLDAMVGGYQAYRNGLRQKMVSAGDDNIRMLTRVSLETPENTITGLGLADFWFGAVGLAEAIKPGVTTKFRNAFHQPEPKLVTGNDGRQYLDFSKITPRNVVVTSSSGSEVAMGYQRSPFYLPRDTQWTDFTLSDPKGDWVELDDIVGQMENYETGTTPRFVNPHFADNINGWRAEGDVQIVSGVNGNAAQLTSSASIEQNIYLPIDIEGTSFEVSALVTNVEELGAGRGCMKLAWSSAPSTITEACLPTATERGLVKVRVKKPLDDDELIVKFVSEGRSAYQFENLALLNFGAKQEGFENSGFEDGITGWSISNSEVIKFTDRLDEVIEGAKSLKFAFNGTQEFGKWYRLERDIDIAADPAGTRYLFRFKVGDRELDGAKFDVQFRITNPDVASKLNTAEMDWWDAAVVTNESPDIVTAVIRKREGETKLKLQLRLEQKEQNSNAFVIIDDLEFHKQRLF